MNSEKPSHQNGTLESPGRAASAGRILLADDEDGFLQTTASLLRNEGYECTCVSDGASVAREMELDSFDVVIADIHMPGNNDLELLKSMREGSSDTAIILVTGYPSSASAIESLNLGVAGYLVKPFEFEDLLAVLGESVTAVRSRRRISDIHARLERLAADVGKLSKLENAGSRSRTPAESANAILDIAFDGVVGILLTLKEELGRATIQSESLSGWRSSGNPAFSKLVSTAFEMKSDLERLSPREREVLIRLVAGDRVGNIASDLFISPNTVRNHLKSIFAKLGVGSQVELLSLIRGNNRRQSG